MQQLRYTTRKLDNKHYVGIEIHNNKQDNKHYVGIEIHNKKTRQLTNYTTNILCSNWDKKEIKLDNNKLDNNKGNSTHNSIVLQLA